jgi:hypothetical protein
MSSFWTVGKKVKFALEVGHEDSEGGKKYSSNLSLTSALDRGVWLTPHPGRFRPGKETGTHWMGPRAGLNGVENLGPTGIPSPDLPARNEGLYRLIYPGHGLLA